MSVTPIFYSVFISYSKSRDRQCLGYFLFFCCAISTMAPSDIICSFYVEEEKKKKKEKKVLAESGQNLTTHSCKGGGECSDLLWLERQTKDKGSGRGLKWANTQFLFHNLSSTSSQFSPLAKLSKRPLIQRRNWGDALGSFLKLVLLK